jgi:hypothetical protein
LLFWVFVYFSGAIYINSMPSIGQTFSFSNLTFINCSANYGANIYLVSASFPVVVTLDRFNFTFETDILRAYYGLDTSDAEVCLCLFVSVLYVCVCLCLCYMFVFVCVICLCLCDNLRAYYTLDVFVCVLFEYFCVGVRMTIFECTCLYICILFLYTSTAYPP